MPVTSTNRTPWRYLLAALVLAATTGTAAAQGPGVRAGVSIDPDQVFIGGHYETEALIDRLHFRPNIEAGFGDDLTTIALNFEFAYKFPARRGWHLYAGAGPAINFYSFDADRFGDRDSESEAGMNFLIGVEQRDGLFFEFKVGAIDSPNLKFAVGWTFK